MKTSKAIKALVFCLLVTMSAMGQSLISIDIHANELTYDSKRDKIYATIRSLDTNYGNSLVQINPYTGSIENSIFIGSEPTCMDITKDTNYVYIGLDGASFVKRVDLNTFQVDQTIALGTGSNGPTFAKDIATVNLSPELVVIARKRINVTPQHDGVVAYFNGVLLPGVTPPHTGSTFIDSADDTNLVFGYNAESTEYGFRRMSIDSVTGVTLLGVNQLSMGYNRVIQYEQGLVYSSGGHIVDPYLTPPTFVGTYTNISTNYNVEPDSENNKTFFCTVSNGLKIRRYNLQTMVFIDEITLGNAYPNNFQLPKSSQIIRYGDRGLAMIVHENYFDNQDRRVILYESCLVKEGADLQVATELSNSSIHVGDTLELKVIVSNIGGVPAEFVQIADTLSNTFEIISAFSSSGTLQYIDNIINWTIESIPTNQSDTATFVLYFTEQGDFMNNVYAVSNTFDCNSSDNTLYDSITVDASIMSATTIEAEDYELFVFPNPVSDMLNLSFELQHTGEVLFSLINLQGEVLFAEKSIGNSGSNYKIIDLKNFSNGVYILNIQINNRVKKPVKVVKI